MVAKQSRLIIEKTLQLPH